MATINSQKHEITLLMNRLLDSLVSTASSKAGDEGVKLRQAIGDLRANFLTYLSDQTFAAKLLACFVAAQTANVTLASLTAVHNQLFSETPVGDIAKAIVQVAIIFCLAAESRLITAMVFVSRDDVEAMIKTMRDAFDAARELAADAIDSESYQNLTLLAGALINHLANTSRPLPRMVTFNLPKTLPALVLSNRIYYDATRSEEIIAENHIIHPAFCPREIRGLSA